MLALSNSYPIKRALVVEGGGMRGVFAAGVLDAFLDKRLRHFDGYYGVSCGALNLSSFIAGQRGRSLDTYTNLCLDPQFINVVRHIRGGNLFDLDWLFEKIAQDSVLNFRRFKHLLIDSHFTVVNTCVESGQPIYHRINDQTPLELINDMLKASSALPMIYRNPVPVAGQLMCDGSLSDPLPVQKAISDGHDQVVVIRTRPAHFRKKMTTTSRLFAWQQRLSPAIGQLIKDQHTIYNQGIESAQALALENNTQLIQIAPEKHLQTSRGSRQRNLLVSDYHHGYTLGYQIAEQLTSSAN